MFQDNVIVKSLRKTRKVLQFGAFLTIDEEDTAPLKSRSLPKLLIARILTVLFACEDEPENDVNVCF